MGWIEKKDFKIAFVVGVSTLSIIGAAYILLPRSYKDKMNSGIDKFKESAKNKISQFLKINSHKTNDLSK